MHNVSDTVRTTLLFFARPRDPPSVQWIRSEETRHVIRMWLDALHASERSSKCDCEGNPSSMPGDPMALWAPAGVTSIADTTGC